jgi:type IV pilus assembly protein PilM
MIDRLVQAVRGAGLRPEGIDLSAFAMIRALHTPAATNAGDVVLYVNAGGLTNLAVASGSQCLFTRVASTGVEGMVTELAERRALTVDHARAWLTHVGLDAPLQEVDGDPQIVADARSVLADGARRIADDVRNSLEFYAAQEDATPVQRAVLTGPAAAIGGFADELSRMLALPLVAATVGEARVGALAGVDAARVTVAAGLAIGEDLE